MSCVAKTKGNALPRAIGETKFSFLKVFAYAEPQVIELMLVCPFISVRSVSTADVLVSG